jgi:hypothetical protein
MPKSIICCVVILWLGGTAFAADFHAKVIHITDGDTFTVLNEAKEQVKLQFGICKLTIRRKAAAGVHLL